MVRNDTALTGINTGRNGRAIYHRGTRIYRVMVSKSDAFTRELPKRRSILLGHKIRTHPVPHNHHYMTLRFRGYDRGGRQADDQKQQGNCSAHSRMIEQGASISSPPCERERPPLRTADATAIRHEPSLEITSLTQRRLQLFRSQQRK